jgi:DNA-binding NtrC family response regulator
MTASLLVVDDEPTILRSLVRTLRAADFRVTPASTGEETVDLVLKAPRAFDALLIDWKLPKMSGIDVLKLLQRQHVDLPAVVFTGYGTMELAVEAIHAGAIDCVAKPFVDTAFWMP